MGDRLLDKVCIVTGSAQGIGAAYARAMAKEGADIAIIDLKRIDQAKDVEDDVKALGRRALTLKADVTDPDEMNAMAKTVIEEFGHVDCLVNNAALDVRPAHCDLGRLPGRELHGHHQRVERGGSLLVGAAPRLDRQHLVDGRVPVAAPHDVLPPAMTHRRPRSRRRATGSPSGWSSTRPARWRRCSASRNIRVNAVCPGVTMSPATKAVVPEPIIDALPRRVGAQLDARARGHDRA